MTLREKIADWISGGALSEARKMWVTYELRSNLSFDKRAAALKQIIAQETPSANATVKRMANIAREALR